MIFLPYLNKGEMKHRVF